MMTEATTLLEAALGYAARGWPVLPLHAPVGDGRCSCDRADCGSIGKHPRTQHGLKDASTDENQITEWWRLWRNANVGVLTGAASGLLVVDIDPRHGGEQSLEQLQEDFEWPDTVIAKTGGNGWHFFFHTPPGEKVRSGNGTLAPGIDLKADGGYVVAPPSLHASGRRYEWESQCCPDDLPAAPLPSELLKRLSDHKGKTKTPKNGTGERIPRGERNATLTSIAGSMRRAGMVEAEVVAALLTINGTRCQSPLPESEVRRIAASVGKYPPKKTKLNQAQVLIRLGEARAEFFHSGENEGYADIHVDGHRETWRIRSKTFRRWLIREFYAASDKPPGAQAVQDALAMLEARALFESQQRDVYLRIAGTDEIIYLDLCDPQWRVIEITATGWRLLADPPVRFRRAHGMRALPVPVSGLDLAKLRPFVNVRDDGEWVLILCWLLAAYRPGGPYPILIIHGEQGAAKSTLMRIVRELLDPNAAPLRSGSRDVRDLMIGASNTWCLSFDNLSGIASWLSDAFCRLSTGGGFATRELYSDSDEVIFAVKRPLMLNAISEIATRGDLLDRVIILHLPAIDDDRRIDEKLFWQDFEKAKPQILGALLDAVSVAIKNLPKTHLAAMPRMADFARWSVAVEPALACDRGAFMGAYIQNRLAANELSLEASPIALAIRGLIESGGWTGTANDLLEVLTEKASDATVKQKTWPKSARALGNTLRRLAPNLRKIGIDVHFYRAAGANSRRMIRIRKRPKSSVANVATVADSANSQGNKELSSDANCDANCDYSNLLR